MDIPLFRSNSSFDRSPNLMLQVKAPVPDPMQRRYRDARIHLVLHIAWDHSAAGAPS